VTVGSASPGSAGSSERTAGISVQLAAAWFTTCCTPDGTGSSMATRNRTVIVAPAASAPTSTRTGVVPVTVPAVVVIDPGTNVVWAGIGSSTTTALAVPAP